MLRVVPAALVALVARVVLVAQAEGPEASAGARLVGRAVLPAATFAPGPTSGSQLGPGPINGQTPPFERRQPVQGFSAVLDAGGGRFLALADNGFGALENSADFHLRVYTIRPEWKTRDGGSGTIAVEGFFELRDPDRHVPFAITHHFSAERVLTGADFDPESMRRAPDGTFWFGDEFGPFLLHTDATGRLLEPPFTLPDFGRPGSHLRSPQNPLNEESATVRVMNAMRAHASARGAAAPVLSPSHRLLRDDKALPETAWRASPPSGSGLRPAAGAIIDLASAHRAGYRVVTWTVNDLARMRELMRAGVDGIISDRPDLLRQAVAEFDADGDGRPGDLLDADGLVDAARFDAQGHRGARNLRPENTLPAMEAALDHLVSTLEMDAAVARDGVAVLDHDPYVSAQKCRAADGSPYTERDEALVKDRTHAELQARFVCDRVFRGPEQSNDLALSPVSVAFAAAAGLPHPYAMPTLAQVFAFVDFYVDHYGSGAGRGRADAGRRARNAARVRFNIETKLNPRRDLDRRGRPYVSRTAGPEAFVEAVGGAIEARGLSARADIQSFDFRTLLLVHERHPPIRTSCLLTDDPRHPDPASAGSDEGTNLQDEAGRNTQWLAGLPWPYRVTRLDHPFRVPDSGGFEAMALSADGRRLIPLLEKPLVGESRSLLAHVFDLASRRYTGQRFSYRLEPDGLAASDFALYGERGGLVLERDGSEGDLRGLKAVYAVDLAASTGAMRKMRLADLLAVPDPHRISEPAEPGDVGIGPVFAMPFVTIEALVVLDRRRIGVLNDNNFPFSVGRHRGSRRPDDTEFVLIELDRSLGP